MATLTKNDEIKKLSSFLKKSKLGNFGERVYSALVENFSQTFFVGGMVRDLLLGKEIHDIDIATSAMPDQVAKILNAHKITYSEESEKYKNLGIIVVPWRDVRMSITTFREDIYGDSRYPKVTFTKNVKKDANRRDFSINSLYLKPKIGKILDFQNGLKDLKLGLIKFIGIPEKRIKEDPLRIIRALRFALVLNFKIDKKTFSAIKNNFNFTKNLTQSRIKKEIDKVKNKNQKNILQKVINNPKLLDKYFKSS